MDWEVVEFDSREEAVESFVRGRDLGCGGNDSFVVVKDIERGCVGSSRKMLRDIRKKYNGIRKCKDKGDEYIAKSELV